MTDKGQGAEFITARLGFGAVFVRMILVYGLQDKDNINTISSFYENITVQTERAVLVGDSVFLAGDFNAKLGRGIIPNDRYDMNHNGQSLYKVITNYNLTVLNALDIYSGTFARIKNKNPDKKSVMYYTITSNDLVPFLKSMAIDESKKITACRELDMESVLLAIMHFLWNLISPSMLNIRK